MRDHLLLFINGQRLEISGDDAGLTLAEFLRQRQGLVGTKIVCNEGDCGACSVLVGRRVQDRDCLTYQTIDRIEMLMDVGKMINPGVDYGQMIGGFVQGMGWVRTEELVYEHGSGRLLSTSPTTYKIPNATDIPAVFNVDTIDNPKHTINVRRSKVVGEPPLMLGVSVWRAAKHAINQLNGNCLVNLSLPATCEANLICMTETTQSMANA